jgi:hypothetical protein
MQNIIVVFSQEMFQKTSKSAIPEMYNKKE